MYLYSKFDYVLFHFYTVWYVYYIYWILFEMWYAIWQVWFRKVHILMWRSRNIWCLGIFVPKIVNLGSVKSDLYNIMFLFNNLICYQYFFSQCMLYMLSVLFFTEYMLWFVQYNETFASKYLCDTFLTCSYSEFCYRQITKMLWYMFLATCNLIFSCTIIKLIIHYTSLIMLQFNVTNFCTYEK